MHFERCIHWRLFSLILAISSIHFSMELRSDSGEERGGVVRRFRRSNPYTNNITSTVCRKIDAAELVTLNETERNNTGCALIPGPVSCGPEHDIYRSINGTCNNRNNPIWGSAHAPVKRYMKTVYYDDGKGIPRNRSAIPGKFLPSARDVSHAVVIPAPVRDSGLTLMVMAFGQYIDHDLSLFPVIKGDPSLDCCGSNVPPSTLAENGGPCFPIMINETDAFYSNVSRTCMSFVRSVSFVDINGKESEPREQINVLTSYIDASSVYGSTKTTNDKLRAAGGKLKVGRNNMLPDNGDTNCKLVNTTTDYCVFAGDSRVNVFVGLQIFHTVFHRYHNQLVDGLKLVNPHWADEKLYQEARKIVAALHQHITYAEYLPSFLSNSTLDAYRLRVGDYSGYMPNVSADCSNVFSTAAFRFGHSQIRQIVKVGNDTFQLQDTLMRPHLSLTRFDEVLMGIVDFDSEDVDSFFAEGVNDRLFENNATLRDGRDLVALNIQRGRDHGLPPYNEFRKFCNLPVVTSFDPNHFFEASKLAMVYESPDDIDVFIGAVLEKHGENVTGPLLQCLLAQQFYDSKFGDRFFYETTGAEGFTQNQLLEIKNQTMAYVMCATTGVERLPKELMCTSRPCPRIDCKAAPQIDLRMWADNSNRISASLFAFVPVSLFIVESLFSVTLTNAKIGWFSG